MEWYQVVKLPSATIPCFFRLLFIERKRQGLILGKKRLNRVVSETKRLRLLHTKQYELYQLIRMVCVGIVVYQSSSLPFFFFPLQPLLLSIYLSNSPLKQINCLRPPCPANTTSGISRKAFLLNIGRPSSRPIRCVTLYRPAHRADRVTTTGNSI